MSLFTLIAIIHTLTPLTFCGPAILDKLLGRVVVVTHLSVIWAFPKE